MGRAGFSLRWLRWALLALYLAIILGLVGLAVADDGWFFALILLVLTFGSQGLFLYGSGRLELHRPIRGWRLVFPTAMASLMLTLLVGAVGLALSELFYLDQDWLIFALLGLMAISWLVWTGLIWVYCQGRERFDALSRLTGLVFGGSLASLLVSVPAHIVVSRRPGCFVGLLTFFGIAGGLYVMFWSFGPGIILLFWREKRRFELRAAGRSGSETPQAFGPESEDPSG